MTKESREIVSVRCYDSLFVIEETAHGGAFSYSVSERTAHGMAQEYTTDTYMEALTRFAYCIDMRAQYELRHNSLLSIENNGILTDSACIKGSLADDFTNKIVILKLEILRPEYRFASEQIQFAQGGFGCSPTASGRMVSCLNLYSGKDEVYSREDFMGICDLDKLPPWALTAWEELHDAPKAREEPPHKKNEPTR